MVQWPDLVRRVTYVQNVRKGAVFLEQLKEQRLLNKTALLNGGS
jgi:hypothetical protein